MGLSAIWRPPVLIAIAVAAVALACASTCHFMGVRSPRFEQRAVPEADVASLDATVQELLSLADDARGPRLAEIVSASAAERDVAGLAATLEAMSQAATCRLVASDGYGPSIVKAIYEVADGQGPTRRVALLFERTGGRLAPLTVAY